MTSYNELVSGTDTFVQYAEETTFKDGTTPNTIWGSISTFQVTKKRNLQMVYGTKDSTDGGQQPRTTLKGKYEGTVSVTYKPVVWSAVKHILGSVSGAGTSASPFSYTHASKPASICIGDGMDDVSVDSQRHHKGCVCTSFTVRFQEGQAPTVTQEYQSADIGVSTTLDSVGTLASGSEYNFDGGSLELPTGTVIPNIIESGTLTITREPKMLFGLNETAQSYVLGKTVYKLSLTMKRYNDDILTSFLGSATALSSLSSYSGVKLAFSNGASKYVYFTFSTVTIDTHTDDETLNEAVGENVDFVAQGLTVTERTS